MGRRIDRLLERLARGEADHPPGRNRRHRPGLGVAADARPLPMDLPRTKTAHDHGFPLLSAGLDGAQDGREFLGNPLDNLRFSHRAMLRVTGECNVCGAGRAPWTRPARSPDQNLWEAS